MNYRVFGTPQTFAKSLSEGKVVTHIDVFNPITTLKCPKCGEILISWTEVAPAYPKKEEKVK